MSNVPILGQKPQGPVDPLMLPLAALLQEMEAKKSPLVKMPMRGPNGKLLGYVVIGRGPMAIEVQAAVERMAEYLQGNKQFDAVMIEFLETKIQPVAAMDDKKLKGEKNV